MLTFSSTLSRWSGIDCTNIPEDHIILTEHPIIISTLCTPGLRKKISSKALEIGYTCMPVSDEQSNREPVVGLRHIPSEQFLRLLSHLRNSDEDATTLTNQGMRVPLVESVMYQNYFYLEEFDIPHGYPHNSFDISFTCYTSDLVNIGLGDNDGIIKQCVLFSSVDRRTAPAFDISGSFKRKLVHPDNCDQDADTVITINTYFPLVKQCGGRDKQLITPDTIRIGQTRLETCRHRKKFLLKGHYNFTIFVQIINLFFKGAKSLMNSFR